ncbi:ATP-binding protein [Candidatus Pacearchaeota archaeon]|nr:ATP-binding protein [Candidatus Pacearchaeota archaeon]
MSKKAFNEHSKEEIVFSDRGFGDTLGYYEFHKLKIPKDEFDYAKKFKCPKIFILDFLKVYEKDKLRQENIKEQRKIHRSIINMYKKLGYNPIIVPFMTIQERVDFILKRV